MLASRARRRVQRGGLVAESNTGPDSHTGTAHQRAVVQAFLEVSHSGDFEALLALLDPYVVFRTDPNA